MGGKERQRGLNSQHHKEKNLVCSTKLEEARDTRERGTEEPKDPKSPKDKDTCLGTNA